MTLGIIEQIESYFSLERPKDTEIKESSTKKVIVFALAFFCAGAAVGAYFGGLGMPFVVAFTLIGALILTKNYPDLLAKVAHCKLFDQLEVSATEEANKKSEDGAPQKSLKDEDEEWVLIEKKKL